MSTNFEDELLPHSIGKSHLIVDGLADINVSKSHVHMGPQCSSVSFSFHVSHRNSFKVTRVSSHG